MVKNLDIGIQWRQLPEVFHETGIALRVYLNSQPQTRANTISQ